MSFWRGKLSTVTFFYQLVYTNSFTIENIIYIFTKPQP